MDRNTWHFTLDWIFGPNENQPLDLEATAQKFQEMSKEINKFGDDKKNELKIALLCTFCQRILYGCVFDK